MSLVFNYEMIKHGGSDFRKLESCSKMVSKIKMCYLEALGFILSKLQFNYKQIWI